MWQGQDGRDPRMPLAQAAAAPPPMQGMPALAPPVVAAPGMMLGPGPPGVVQPVFTGPPQMVMPVGGLSAMQHLAALPRVEVQEKANVLQEVTALLGAEVEMANRYKVLDPNGMQVFYAVERTDCCRRQMQNSCCHDCASWEVDVLYTPTGGLSQHFLALQRPCQCTCCCFNRPVADVIDAPSGQKIGSFRDPCTCTSLKFQVRDATDTDVLVVNGGHCCCQPGIWCPLPCGPCARVKFSVEDAHSGHEVATIQKRVPGCLTWCFAPDVDNYHVTYDQVQNAQWKAILLAFTIFMDFRYFNVNANERAAERAREYES